MKKLLLVLAIILFPLTLTASSEKQPTKVHGDKAVYIMEHGKVLLSWLSPGDIILSTVLYKRMVYYCAIIPATEVKPEVKVVCALMPHQGY